MHEFGVVLTWLVRLTVIVIGAACCYVAVDRGIERLELNASQSLVIMAAIVIGALLLVFALNYVWVGVNVLIISAALAQRYQAQLREEARMLGWSTPKVR